jgi:FdhD protein
MNPDLGELRNPLGLHQLGYAEPLLEHPAVRGEDGRFAPSVERIAEEVPVAFVYNGLPHVVMMATPADLEDFALGFSLTEELVPSPSDVLDISVVRYSRGIELQVTVPASCEEEIRNRNRRLTGRTGCGICGAESVDSVLRPVHPVSAGLEITASAVRNALAALPGLQPLNAAAGAVHAAAWAGRDGAVALVREDVGRHNALDKLIGALARAGADPACGFLVVTSRASFEMVQKATVFGAPLLAAISGATGLAVRLADQAGLTLVGFARGERLTVYTHPSRLR